MLLADVSDRVSKLAHDYYNATTIHPLAIGLTLAMGLWLMIGSRQKAMIPWLVMICFIPSAQRVVIAGADFTLLRIMVLFGVARFLFRGELADVKLRRLDWIYIGWVAVSMVIYTLRRGDMGAAVYSCGFGMDMLGGYLIPRVIIQKLGDLRSLLKILAVLAFVVSVFFAVENRTRRNSFAIFGGVPEVTVEREGRLRCQGAFSHPIVAGVFWSVIAALLLGGVLSGGNVMLHGLGFVSCVGIIAASASSTPLLGLIAACLFWSAWPVRSWMKHLLLASPFILTILHFLMDGPVWHLVARVSAVGGSTGHHRYVLIDSAIRHVHEWFFLGTVSTGHWSRHFQMFDITNQYILEGVRGGILRLFMFLILIFLTTRSVARGTKLAKNNRDAKVVYSVAASIFVSCICFIGVSYFGQIDYLWYMTLAIGNNLGDEFFYQTDQVQDFPDSEDSLEFDPDDSFADPVDNRGLEPT